MATKTQTAKAEVKVPTPKEASEKQALEQIGVLETELAEVQAEKKVEDTPEERKVEIRTRERKIRMRVRAYKAPHNIPFKRESTSKANEETEADDS